MARINFKKGDKLVVTPVPSGLAKNYPASKIKSETTVTVLDDGASEGLDVYDVELPNGDEDSIYGFQIKGKGKGKKASADLRTKLIRLAHAKPELRADILPLLTKQANVVSYLDLQELAKEEAKKAYQNAMEKAAYTYHKAVLAGLLAGLGKFGEVKQLKEGMWSIDLIKPRKTQITVKIEPMSMFTPDQRPPYYNVLVLDSNGHKLKQEATIPWADLNSVWMITEVRVIVDEAVSKLKY